MSKAATERVYTSLPYYRWYVRDYRASRNANALNYIERGLYRELLDECWEEGAIPDDLERLAEICRCPLSVMQRTWPKIRKMFAPVDGMDGIFLRNPRLDSERTKTDQTRIARAQAGKLGGQAKSKGAKEMVASASNSKQKPYSRAVKAEQSSSSSAVAIASVVDAQLPRCEECGSQGAAFLAGIHKPGCSCD